MNKFFAWLGCLQGYLTKAFEACKERNLPIIIIQLYTSRGHFKNYNTIRYAFYGKEWKIIRHFRLFQKLTMEQEQKAQNILLYWDGTLKNLL